MEMGRGRSRLAYKAMRQCKSRDFPHESILTMAPDTAYLLCIPRQCSRCQFKRQAAASREAALVSETELLFWYSWGLQATSATTIYSVGCTYFQLGQLGTPQHTLNPSRGSNDNHEQHIPGTRFIGTVNLGEGLLKKVLWGWEARDLINGIEAVPGVTCIIGIYLVVVSSEMNYDRLRKAGTTVPGMWYFHRQQNSCSTV